MRTVTSKDGTVIAFDQSGSGPAVILVDGALQYRAFDQGMKQLADLLAQHFTVIHFDRRARGDSTNAQSFPFDREDGLRREIEDLEALIDEAGGSAFIYSISSGAALAMEAAARLNGKIKKLAMYEAPYNDDETARQAWKDYTRQLEDLLKDDRKGDAVGLFMMLVGASADDVAGMRQHPMWPLWESAAPSLAYDHIAALPEDSSVPVETAAWVKVPTLVMTGSATYPFTHESAKTLATVIPHAEHRVLEGQTHEVDSQALAPVLIEFFKSE
ncbi:MAG TPA: alpha/beta hydrolase [Anaerolineales bacterium]|nr:alpha/beta hydrolase [Anaerolineales bacterium]